MSGPWGGVLRILVVDLLVERNERHVDTLWFHYPDFDPKE